MQVAAADGSFQPLAKTRVDIVSGRGRTIGSTGRLSDPLPLAVMRRTLDRHAALHAAAWELPKPVLSPPVEAADDWGA